MGLSTLSLADGSVADSENTDSANAAQIENHFRSQNQQTTFLSVPNSQAVSPSVSSNSLMSPQPSQSQLMPPGTSTVGLKLQKETSQQFSHNAILPGIQRSVC